MLIDGNSLTYRAFFALPTDMATAGGQVTNAVFGFTSMLLNLVRDHKPDRIVVAFDRPERTFRHEAVETYKANRKEAPDILRQQMGLVRQVIETLRIPTVDSPGYEADDVIATLATQAASEGQSVMIVTGDRDTYQLVEDPLVKVLYNKRGVSDYALYDEAGIRERTGVDPDKYVEYAALRGDPSDNLPGVPGVGEKTAAKLINTYGSLEEVFAHLDEQTPKLRANLAASEEQVRNNAEVMALVRDVDLAVDPDDLVQEAFSPEEVRELFHFLEFNSLLERLDEAFPGRVGDVTGGVEVLAAESRVVAGLDDALAVIAELAEDKDEPLAFEVAWGAEPGKHPLGLALATHPGAGETAFLPADLWEAEEVGRALDELFSVRSLTAHDAKPATVAFRQAGIDVRNLALDTKLAAYLLDPADTRYRLEDLLRRFSRYELAFEGEDGGGQLALAADAVDHGQLAAVHALAVALITGPIREALDATGLRKLNDEIEVPLVRVLAKMECVGVGVDVAELKALNDRIGAECERLRREIVADAGGEFNVNSTKQLREVLFEKLALTPQKKTKTGYSTDAASLERLRGEHPIIEHLLDYREVEKLRSTYAEGLLAEVGPDGRIHATFNQTVARTGRLSSDAPNLHNIPVRSEIGREFRRAFVPAEGYELMVADYNQIELRCIAHLAEDPGLIEAFESGADIHRETAARVFGLKPDDVGIEHRSKAKMVSYGLAYGMEAYGLGQRLNIPTEEAQEILDAYFEAFPRVKAYMEATVAEARERGYTETLFGRRRQIPELSSANYRIRQAGERQAMNAGIQGLAADIFKIALVGIDSALEEEQMGSRLILQVHDEVILEVPPEEHEAASALVVDMMRGSFDLRVPLEVDVAFGVSWAEAKG
ncbi:MAG: DNA polymerase I [Acidimicrobiales bacterium]|nr:MAG: DNA polymerase I [Actinomycetota bacterium]MBV6509533.1 DNA polymerase I [Acidimicrobiales bacterium]RIK06649.1 MAG: DNA polymerase I [Acidobacteriota bacterium]